MLRGWWERSPWLAGLAVLHAGLFVVFLFAAMIDPTPVLGVGRWIKPIKFAASIALFLGTIAWILPAVVTDPRIARRLAGVIGASMLLEMVGIAMQAARATTSHFNVATTFDAIIFRGMGLLIAANTVAVALLGLRAWQRWRRERDGYVFGIALGIAVFLVGSLIGGVMIANNAHTVGGGDGGPGLALVGWSTVGGDLRIAHFVGLHALQGLPLLAWRVGPRAAALAAAGWLAVTLVLCVQALLGVPLLGVG